ncbi:TolB family protein, partial [Salmonella enterica]|uniref:TolB family protein n=1 Tax=Salmonella enterica TaxID=28901 RepID=UPI0030968C77
TTSPDINFSHLYIVSTTPGATPKAITKGFYRFNGADFTPDGKQIIFTGNMDDTQHPDRALESCIYLVNTDGSNLEQLLGEKGRTFNSPKISPSGK